MANNFYKQGSHGSDTLTGLMSFHGFMAANHISNIKSCGATGSYQVTSGKTLYITRIIFGNTSAAGGTEVSIGYGDTDIGQDSAADPTNYVKVIGNTHIGATTVGQTPLIRVNSTSLPNADVSILASIPASKYPTVFATAVTGFYLEGFEV